MRLCIYIWPHPKTKVHETGPISRVLEKTIPRLKKNRYPPKQKRYPRTIPSAKRPRKACKTLEITTIDTLQNKKRYPQNEQNDTRKRYKTIRASQKKTIPGKTQRYLNVGDQEFMDAATQNKKNKHETTKKTRSSKTPQNTA